MPLRPGTRIGVFEIVAPLGAGGMGEVYRGRDTTLNRDVAIKVLPELFAVDAERVARFTREAQTLATLNHPNIAQIHGLEGQAGSLRALVMELVDGEDLSAIIARGPLPLADALPISRQIAGALEAAHEAGIIHRDLKPANIKVRTDGTVKVLDFGLAKALAPEGTGSSPDAINSPTLTARATAMGVILGTAAYMAPEQAKGKAVDKRADIWAFGVVLYEMLSGRRAFEGDDASTTMAAVLMREPDFGALPSTTPPRIRTLIARCLVKDPKQRLRDIGDARLVLDGGVDDLDPATGAHTVVPGPSSSSWRRALPAVASALITLALAAAAYVAWKPPVAAPEVLRFSLSVAGLGGGLFRSQSQVDFVFTHDGRALIYGSATGTGARFLSIRRLDQLSNTVIAGTEGAIGPFLSPDDKFVGFLDPGFTYITKAPTAGGVPVRVVQSRRTILSATWTSDNTIVFSGAGSGLFEVPDAGGAPSELTKLDAAAGDTSHIWPAAIPGTSGVLFAIASGDPLRTSRIAILDLATRRVKRSELLGTFPRFLRPGHVVYADAGGALVAVPFDPRRLEFTGSPAPLGVQIGMTSSGAASFDVSTDGRLAYATSGVQAARALVWVDRTGKETAVPAPSRSYYYARVSPDGSRLSLDVRDQDQDIWTLDLRGTLARVTRGPAPDQYGLWTPDGRQLVCTSVRDGKQGLYLARVDGVGEPVLITDTAGAYPNAVTPDGAQLVFRSSVGSKGQNDLFIVPIAGGGSTAKPLIATEFDELNAAISPDGKWIAFESNLSGRLEVYVRPFPDVNGGQWAVSTAGGIKPGWSPNGREIYFLSTDRTLMTVPVTTTNGFSPGTPVALFDASPYFTMGSGRNFDISQDGARFIFSKSPVAKDAAADAINVVINWAAEVAPRLPRASR